MYVTGHRGHKFPSGNFCTIFYLKVDSLVVFIVKSYYTVHNICIQASSTTKCVAINFFFVYTLFSLFV